MAKIKIVLLLRPKLHYTTVTTLTTDMLYNTTNGRAHNNSTTNFPTSRHVKMLGCSKFCPLVLNLLYNKL